MAEPLEAIQQVLRPGALDQQAEASRLGPLRRMAHVRRQQENRAFVQVYALRAFGRHDRQVGIALELVEKLLEGIVVVVVAPVRAADHGDDEVGVLPELLDAHRRLQLVRAPLDPGVEIDCRQHAVQVEGLVEFGGHRRFSGLGQATV